VGATASVLSVGWGEGEVLLQQAEVSCSRRQRLFIATR
jgi:hypothetical protein